jgi:hypothetical protein
VRHNTLGKKCIKEKKRMYIMYGVTPRPIKEKHNEVMRSAPRL